MVFLSHLSRACPRRPRLANSCPGKKGFLAALILALVSPGLPGSDFHTLQLEIAAQRDVVRDLESRFNRVDHRLLEPLLSLARVQSEANRFDDAELTIDQALQVVRIRDGLYTPAQYPLLEQAVDNNIRRGSWYALSQDLEHLRWLYFDQFEGSVDDQVQRLMWLSSIYQLGAFRDLPHRRVEHLKGATGVNELAARLANQDEGLSLENRIQAMYALALQYQVEAKGILSGGEFSLSIRSHQPESGKVDRRKLALRKRYIYGLRLLKSIRDAIQLESPDDVEALIMADLGIADWHLQFDRGEAFDHYSHIYQRMVEAGFPVDRIDTFFGRPVSLPRPTLALNLDDALADQQADASEPLTLLEKSSSFPGLVEQLLPGAIPRSSSVRRFDRIGARVSLEPRSGSRHWLAGTYRTTLGTATTVEILAPADGSGEADQVPHLKKLEKNLRELHFRPVLLNGELRSSDVAIQYLVRRNEWTREISLEGNLVGQL